MKTFEPNTTPNPNWVYDEEMSKMNETELKVVLLVTRKTLGWVDSITKERKKQDYISQSQFIKFTGQSHTAIAKAIQVAVKIGWIIARDKEGNLCNTPERRRRRKVWYQLGKVFKEKKSKQQCGLESKQQCGLESKQQCGLESKQQCGLESKQQCGLDENLSNNLAKSKQQSCIHLSNNVDNTKETNTKENIQKLAVQNTADQIMASLSGQPIKNCENISSQEIVDFIYLFEKINPTINYGNKTTRSAVEILFKRFGKDKAIEMAEYAIAIFGRKYAPVISTPYQLKEKISSLASYKLSNNEKLITKV